MLVALIRATCLAALVFFSSSILIRLNVPITTKNKISRMDQEIMNLRPDAVMFGFINVIIEVMILF
jgi:hypothetical protein